MVVRGECYTGFCKFFSMAKSTFSGSCSCLMLVSDCDSGSEFQCL